MRRGQTADVVVHVARRRPRHPVVLMGAVGDGRHAQLHAGGPDRVVVVDAVEAKVVEAVGTGSRPRVTADNAWRSR